MAAAGGFASGGLVGVDYGLDDTPLWSLLRDQAPGILTFQLLSFLALGTASVWEYRVVHRLLHRLKTGIPLDRPAPYRWQRRLSKILTALILCIFCSNLVSDLLGGFWPMWAPEQAVSVDLAVLEPGASVEHISTETKVHELAPRMYVTNQSTADFESSLYTEYYLCALPPWFLLWSGICWSGGHTMGTALWKSWRRRG